MYFKALDQSFSLGPQVQNPKKAVYLNPVAGERGIVIKNNAGDWAFVVGRWKGFRRGVPGVAGKSVGLPTVGC